MRSARISAATAMSPNGRGQLYIILLYYYCNKIGIRRRPTPPSPPEQRLIKYARGHVTHTRSEVEEAVAAMVAVVEEEEENNAIGRVGADVTEIAAAAGKPSRRGRRRVTRGSCTGHLCISYVCTYDYSASVADPYIPHRYTRGFITLYLCFVGIYLGRRPAAAIYKNIKKWRTGVIVLLCVRDSCVCVKYIIRIIILYYERHFDRWGARPRNSVSA